MFGIKTAPALRINMNGATGTDQLRYITKEEEDRIKASHAVIIENAASDLNGIYRQFTPSPDFLGDIGTKITPSEFDWAYSYVTVFAKDGSSWSGGDEAFESLNLLLVGNFTDENGENERSFVYLHYREI